MADVANESATLLAGLQSEAGLYAKVLALSNEELHLVKEAELERATGVLSRKQSHLDEITVIEVRIKPLKQRWPELKAALPSDRQAPFAAVLKDLSDVLERLIAVERETEDVLARQIAMVRKSPMATAATEERAKRAYGVRKEGA